MPYDFDFDFFDFEKDPGVPEEYKSKKKEKESSWFDDFLSAGSAESDMYVRPEPPPKPRPTAEERTPKLSAAEPETFWQKVAGTVDEFVNPRTQGYMAPSDIADAQIKMEARKKIVKDKTDEGKTVFRPRYKEEYMDEVDPDNSGVRKATQLFKDVGIGALSTAEGVAGGAQWLTDGIIGGDLANQAKLWGQDLSGEEQDFSNQLAQGVGSMGTFFVPGIGVMKGATAVAKISPKLAQWMGAGTMTALEAMTEAGSVYRDVLNETKDPMRASLAATETFTLNVPLLTITNKLGIFGESGSAIKRALVSSLMEGGQEAGQEIISTTSAGKPVKWGDVLTSGAIGAIIGGGTGAVSHGLMPKMHSDAITDDQKAALERAAAANEVPGDTDGSFLTRRLIESGSLEDVKFALTPENAKLWTPEERTHLEKHYARLQATESPTAKLDKTVDDHMQGKTTSTDLLDAFAGEFDNLEDLLQEEPADVNARKIRYGDKQPELDLGTSSMPLFDATNLSSPSEIVDSRTNGEAVYSPTISNTSTINFADMVKEAARWKGAAINVDEALGEDKKARLAHSRITTKGDLDAYLMKKYGIDATTARDVSNELTDKNIPADRTAKPEDFAGEPWVKTTGKDMDVSKVVTEEYEPYSRKNPGHGGNYTWKRVDRSQVGKTIKQGEEADFEDYTIDEEAASGQVHVTELKPHEIKERQDIGIDINEKTKTAITDSFEIAPDLRGKGLGTKLWQKIEDDARKLGAERFELWHVMSDAHEFWRKMGFKPIAGGSEDSRTWVKEKEDFLPKAKKPSVESKKGTTIREEGGEYGEKMYGVDISPAMRKDVVTQGQALYENKGEYGAKKQTPDRAALEKQWRIVMGEEKGKPDPNLPTDRWELEGLLGEMDEAKKKGNFYSNTASMLEQQNETAMPPAEWKKRIEAWGQKFAGIREENQWSGIMEYIDSRSDEKKIPKADLLEYMEETKKGWLQQETEPDERWSSRNLPGGIPGTEQIWTFRLPETDTAAQRISEISKEIDGMGDLFALTPDKRAIFENLIIERDRLAAERKSDTGYHSPHFPTQPNVLLHIRTQKMRDAEGRIGIVAETIQSDWHQEGRDNGYVENMAALNAQIAAIRKEKEDFIHAHGKSSNYGGMTFLEVVAEAKTFDARIGELLERTRSGVPDAPFKDAWHEQGLKRLIDIAAKDPEVEWIGWTPGEAQAERWGKSQKRYIGKVEYTEVEPGKYSLVVQWKPPWTRTEDRDADKFRVQNAFGDLDKIKMEWGAEVADAIRNKEGLLDEATETQDERGIAELNRNVSAGGDYLKLLYDKKLPKFADKYVKKWGAKVEDIKVETHKDLTSSLRPGDRPSAKMMEALGRQFQPVHAITITPQMRQEVTTKGQAFYEPKATYAARAIKALNKAVDFFTGKRVPGPGVLNRSGKTTDRTAAGVRGKEKRHHTVGKMVDDLKNLKPVRLRGADVRTWDEAYEALRITRNKNVEVLQVLYLGAESGKVLYNEACSSRLPGAVHIASPAILASSIHATSLTLKRIAGEGVRVALVHNHPSGDVTASEADKAMTESVGKQLKIRKVEFEGHMIIDHNTYGVIEDGGKYTKRSITDIPAEHAQDPLLSVPVPHDKLGETITRQEHVASIAKDINRGDKYFTILMRSGTKVRGIVNIELGILDEPQQAQAYIKELMVNHGAQDAFVYREEFTDRQVYVLQDLVKGNTIRDAAWEGRWGTQGVAEQGIFPDSSRQFGEDISEQQGKWFEDYGSEFREGKAPYGSETDMIISQAKKNGTYMKAPNGQATKLNPGQWAQVRTKAFKKWFGDWEAAAELQKGIDALAKVVKNQTDAKAAMNNPDLGPVSFYWGNEGTANKAYKDGSGISHIIARRLTEGSTPDDTADTILRIVETIAKGNIVRQYGGKIGRAELSHNGYTAILSKQRFGGKEVWLLTGFKERKEADAKRESYNPEGYAPIDSVGRQKVVAALSDMITKRKDKVNSEISKVVDDNGEPMVVYHGTVAKENFDEFAVGTPIYDEEMGTQRTGSGADMTAYLGSHFTDDVKVASVFGKGMYGEREHVKGKGGRIYPVFLNIKKPTYLDEDTMRDDMMVDSYNSYLIDDAIEQHAARSAADVDELFEQYDSDENFRSTINDIAIGMQGDDLELSQEMATQYRADLQREGYDGIKYENQIEGGIAWIAFEPSQIKSATANRGTFDANEGSILKDKDAPYGEDLGEPGSEEDDSFDFGANVEKAIDENPEEYISLDFKDHLNEYISTLNGLVQQGEPGKKLSDEVTGEAIWWTSTYPEFMQDQGWTSKEVLSALGHSLRGEEMTEKQREIVQAAVSQAVDMFYEDLERWYPNLSGQQYHKAEASIQKATDDFLSRYYTNQRLLKQEKEKADRATMITKSKYQWEKEKKATENKAWEKGAKAVHAVQDPLIKKLQEDLDATVKQRDKIRETAYRLMNEAKTSTTETKAQEEANRNEIEKLNRKITRLKESLEKARKAQPKQAKQSTKALVRIATGQNLDDKVWISEYKLLTEQIRREAMAARQAFAAGNKKGLLAARARYKMMQAQQRAMREIRRETNKIIKDFKKVLKETAEMTPEYADKIKALLEDFDLTRMTGETRLKLEAIRDALVEDPNADIDERTLDTLKRLEKIPIRNISYPGLKAMHDAVMHFATLGKRGPMMIMSQKKVTRDMILKTSIGQMRPAKDVAKEMVDATYSGWKEVKARLAAAKDLYTIHLDTFDNLVESIAGQNSMAYRVLMREIKRGSNERDRIAYDLEDDFMAAQEAFQKRHPEIKDVLGWLSEEVEFAGIKMNRNLALSLYRGWFDPDYQRSIIESGFGLWGSQDRDNPNRVYKIAGDAYGAAVNKLSAADREYADLAIPTIQKSGDLLADKFLEINGYAMPRVEGGIYWRKEVLASERGQDEEQEQMKERFGRPYIFKGMTKKRTGSSAAVWLKPYTVAVREMHKRAADYVGLEEAMGNAAWLMYNSEFRSAFEERYGRPMWRELEKGLKDIAEISTPEASGDMERFFRWLRNNSTIYALAANYGTMLKQLNGAFNYMVYVGPGYLTRAISAYASNPMAVKRLHRSMSVEYRRRRESGYSQDVGNVLQVINKQGTKPSLLTRVGAGGLVPLQQMDIFGVDLGMLAATYQAMDAFKAGKMPDQMRMALDMTDAQVAKLTTAEKAELAYRWADFVTERTQSQNVPEHMSGWQRGGELEKQLSMFFGELQKNLAGFTRGYRAVKRGDPGAKALLLKTILLYAILGTAIDTGVNELRNWFRGRKGDKWWAALLKSATGYLPGVREVVSGVVDMAQGKYYAGGGDTPFERVRNATEKPLKATHGMITATTMKKRRDNAKKFADGLANFVAMTVGIPYPALKEPFRIANREEELRKARAAQRR